MNYDQNSIVDVLSMNTPTGVNSSLFSSYQNRSKLYEKYGLGTSADYVSAGSNNAPLNEALLRAYRKDPSKAGLFVQGAPSVMNSKAAKADYSNISGTVNNYDNNVLTAKSPTTTEGKINELDSTMMTEYDRYIKQINDIASGANLSPTEKASLASLNGILSQNKADQVEANDLYEAGLKVAGIRSGRSQYSPEAQAGLIHNAISKGIQKVQRLDLEATSKIAEVKQNMIDGDLKAAKESHDTYMTMIKDRRDEIFKLSELALKQQEFQFKVKEAGRTAMIKNYEYAKGQGYKGSFADWQNIHKSVNSSSSNPTMITEEFASENGLPDSVVGMTDKDLLSSLKEDYPPMWFSKIYNENSDIPELAMYWKQFKERSDVQGFIAAQEGGDSSGSEYDTGGLPPPIQN